MSQGAASAGADPGGRGSAPALFTPQMVRILVGLMISLFIAAMDSTVVSTALPTIARDLGGFQLYPWVFSGYLLTSTTTIPLWGRAADLAGRRPILMAGIGLFVASSVLCGLSPNMPALIIFRTLQGVGAGGIQPIVFTLIGDLLPPAQRARMQGLFSSVWATAAIVGPVLGATIVSTIGWRWIFDVNLPIGLAAGLLVVGFHEQAPKRVHGDRLDVRGAVLLTVGVALLLVGLGTGSSSGQPVYPIAAIAILVLVLFVFIERRSPHPTVPLDLLRHAVIGPLMLVVLLAGMVQFGITAYAPLYVQEVLGGTAFAAGWAVTPMMAGWSSASALAGWIMMRVGYQRLIGVGSFFLVLGTVMASLSRASFGVPWVSVSTALVGIGMGLFSTPVIIVIQSSVDWSRRGAATALNQLGRTIGGAVGVSLLGVLVQSQVNAGRGATALGSGIHVAFGAMVVTAAMTLAVGVLILTIHRQPFSPPARPPA